MKKIISLVKVLYKSNKNDSNKLTKKNKMIFCFGIIAYILFIFINFWNLFISPLKHTGKPELFVSLMFNLSSIFIFMTSITYLANILYFSNDLENILPFPFKPKEIFTAKLVIVYLYDLLIVFMFLAPGLISYGYNMQENFVFYIYSFLILLLLPIIPILLITVIFVFIMQFLKVFKYKNFFKIFSTIVLLAIIMIFQMNLNNNMTATGEYNPEYISNIGESFRENTPYYLEIAVDILTSKDGFIKLISMLWLFIINLVASVVVIHLFSKIYMKGIYYNLEETNSQKREKRKVTQKIKTKVVALTIKDLKGLFRNATFFVQCVLPIFLIPLMMVLMSGTSVEDLSKEFAQEIPTLKIFYSILVIQFFMIMNHVSLTAISRDGKDEILFIKALPISLEKQIRAKVMPGVLLGIINLIIAILLIYKVLALELVEIIVLIVMGILLNVIQSYIFLIIDLKNPKLCWESELAVVKQNINIFYGILVWLLLIIVISTIGSLFINLNTLSFSFSFTLILFVIFLGLKYYILKNKEKLFDNIV